MPDESLVVDRRQELAGAPGLHALIVGVGEYHHLTGGKAAVADPWGMGQLSSTASSAHGIYEWLVRASDEGRLPAPLATCRLLLSPAAGEVVATSARPATLQRFAAAAKAWRGDCNAGRDEVAFFFFAGHGVQLSREDAVLCLSGFRDPDFGFLHHAVSLANLRNGMAPAPGFEQIARTQLYFADACRVRPEEFAKFQAPGTTEVFDVALAGEDDRCAPIFYGAVSSQAAHAVPGGRTLFSSALLECLGGEAAVAVGEDPNGVVRYGVTAISLNEALLDEMIDRINRRYGADQTYANGGSFGSVTLCTLEGTPEVRLRLELVPAESHQRGRLRLVRQTDQETFEVQPPIQPHPYERSLPYGIYRLELTFDPPPPVAPVERTWAFEKNRYYKTVQVE
jgi:hypothetical protein